MTSEPRYRARKRSFSRYLPQRFAATDPGLSRLRVAAAATVGLGAVLAIEYIYGLAVPGVNVQAAMLLGGISAMQISGALMQPTWRQRLRAVAWQPVVVGAGVAASVFALQLGGKPWQLSLFIPITFAAVILRRFGAQFVTLGLMGWVGYFISLFLSAVPTDIPYLVGAEVLSAATIFALSLLVRGHRPRQALRHALGAWSAQADNVLWIAAQTIDNRRSARFRRRRRARLTSQTAQLTDTALVVEGWLSSTTSEPEKWDVSAIRDQLLDAHLAVDTMVGAVQAISVEAPQREKAATRAARQMLALLGSGDDLAAEDYARRISLNQAPAGSDFPGEDGRAPRRAFADAAEAALVLVASRRAWTQPISGATNRSDFSPAVTLLAGGSLSGSASAVTHVFPHGHRFVHRLSLPTRQAIQVTVAVAIALPIGYQISSVHYPWALVAVFMVFLGTSTRGETAVKATHRVLGTVAGLIVAIPIAILTGGNPLSVIALALIGCFIGHYLMSISYSYLMFCITVVVRQMYNMMQEFSLELLGLRLIETLLGAAISILVAAVIVPISTRDTTAYIRRGLLHAVATLLTDIADKLEAGVPIDDGDLNRTMREIEEHAHRHTVAASPLTWHPTRGRSHQVNTTAHALLASRVRQTVAWIVANPSASTTETAVALRSVARAAQELDLETDGGQGLKPPRRASTLLDHSSGTHPVTQLERNLHAIQNQ